MLIISINVYFDAISNYLVFIFVGIFVKNFACFSKLCLFLRSRTFQYLVMTLAKTEFAKKIIRFLENVKNETYYVTHNKYECTPVVLYYSLIFIAKYYIKDGFFM